MSDTEDNMLDDSQDEDFQDGPSTNSDFAWKRRQEKAVKAAQAEAQAAKREAAFLRAGINPDDTRLSYFVKGYDGELAPDAIRNAATEAGFLAPPPPDPQAEQRSQDAATASKVASYSAGADSTPSEDDLAVSGMKAALAEGGTDALAAFLRSKGIPQVEV
jgi:ribosomal protein L12E/L44/L45/RPP1/RPP2